MDMENPLFFPISYITLFLITFITYKTYKYYSYGSNPNLPPGSIGLPLLGESLEYLRHCWKGKPEKFFEERMVKYWNSSAFKTSLFGEPTIYLVGPSGNKFLFSNEGKLVTPWIPESMGQVIRTPFSMDVLKEERAKGRKVVQSLFNPESHNTYVPLMDSVTQQHFDTYWNNDKEVHVHDLSKRYTFELACRLFISMSDPKEIAELSEPFNDVIDGIISLPINLPGTPMYRAIKGAKKIEKKLIEIMKQRKIDLANNKASPTQDILAYTMSYKDENGQRMREEGIPTNMIGLLLAGHDTTSGAITAVVKYLAEFPLVYDRVYKEQMEVAKSKGPGELLNWKDMQKMKYSWSVAREAMRLIPPSPAVFREALQDIHY